MAPAKPIETPKPTTVDETPPRTGEE